ncbi:UxaA family hydrolase [Miniphocaeibacter massiliensis]|uniref:UxaA family hydrolase n=1 Tax=Miniphocaeibacter massiliensis TaxID=2041841 RepID=UPI000C1BE8DE|nr:UxaA family hydrolase [Miniphocaeibacter massiliensis]
MEEINAVVISKNDNVVVAREKIIKGLNVVYLDLDGKRECFEAIDDIKIYHKIAKEEIKTGEHIVKYGEHIGVASKNIHKGNHVHEHNVDSVRENLDDLV